MSVQLEMGRPPILPSNGGEGDTGGDDPVEGQPRNIQEAAVKAAVAIVWPKGFFEQLQENQRLVQQYIPKAKKIERQALQKKEPVEQTTRPINVTINNQAPSATSAGFTALSSTLNAVSSRSRPSTTHVHIHGQGTPKDKEETKEEKEKPSTGNVVAGTVAGTALSAGAVYFLSHLSNEFRDLKKIEEINKRFKKHSIIPEPHDFGGLKEFNDNLCATRRSLLKAKVTLLAAVALSGIVVLWGALIGQSKTQMKVGIFTTILTGLGGIWLYITTKEQRQNVVQFAQAIDQAAERLLLLDPAHQPGGQ